jgi:MFS transporter, SET family, sugar efflux transporter
MARSIDARTVPFVAVLMAIGFADAITGSYLVLFAADELRLDPVQIGVATSVFTLGGIVSAALAGRWVDRRRTRVPLAAGLAVAALGFGAFTVVRGFLPLLVVCVLAGAINVGFPQVFALEHMSRDVEAAGAVAVLRGGWSIAWAIGPVAASGLVLLLGYDALFGVAAVLLLAGALGARALPRPVGAPGSAALAAPHRWSAVVLPIAAVALFHTAMFVGSFVLPLLVTRDLHASEAWVGVIFGLCAAVEVVVAVVLSLVAGRITPAVGLAGAAGAFVVYFAGMWGAPDLGWVLVLQLLRGLAIAAMGILGIELLQRLLAPHVAAATALFANALAVGSLISGVAAGLLVQLVGLRATLGVCAALAGLAVVCVLLDLAIRRRARREPAVA